MQFKVSFTPFRKQIKTLVNQREKHLFLRIPTVTVTTVVPMSWYKAHSEAL